MTKQTHNKGKKYIVKCTACEINRIPTSIHSLLRLKMWSWEVTYLYPSKKINTVTMTRLQSNCKS